MGEYNVIIIIIIGMTFPSWVAAGFLGALVNGIFLVNSPYKTN